MRTDTTLARSFAAWSTIVTQGRQRCCVVGVRVVLVVVFHGLALGVGQEAQVVVVQAHVCVLTWFESRQVAGLVRVGNIVKNPPTTILTQRREPFAQRNQ